MAYTELIEVETGTTYYFSQFSTYDSFPVVVMYDSEQAFAQAYKPSELQTMEGASCWVADSFRANNYEKECNWVTIPEGISYISIQAPKTQIATVKVYKDAWITSLHSYTSVLPANNNLTGNKAVFFGDSIAYGQYSGSEGFPEYIAGANNMTFRNYAVGGYLLNRMYNQFTGAGAQKIFATLTENDYVIVEGFINDILGTYTPTTIGELTAEGTTEFDTTTFMGLLEDMIYKYQTAGYKAKLGFVLTSLPTRGGSKLPMVRDYWDAAIEVFEKYDVGYLDLYYKPYSYADKLHPDYQGTYDMAQDVEVWMNTL